MPSMKTFIVEITYRVPIEALGENVAEHRQFLKRGYEIGWLLCSGPMDSRSGGMVVARAPSQEDLERFFQDDPYRLKGLASHRMVAFDPVLSQDFIKPSLSGE